MVTVLLAEEDRVEDDVVFYLVFSGSTLHHCASTRKLSSNKLETIAPGKCVNGLWTSPSLVLELFHSVRQYRVTGRMNPGESTVVTLAFLTALQNVLCISCLFHQNQTLTRNKCNTMVSYIQR